MEDDLLNDYYDLLNNITMITSDSDLGAEVENCTCSDMTKQDYSTMYMWFNFLFILILIPVVSICGILFNLLNIFIFSRPSLRNSGNSYLMGLACSDFFVVLTGFFLFWTDSARSYFSFLENTPVLIIYFLPLSYTAQTCSVYFTVFAAFDCFASVCTSSSFARKWCNDKRALQVIIAIIGGSFIYNANRFWQLTLHRCSYMANNGTKSMVEICPTEFYWQINVIYNVYMYLVLLTLIPFLVLTILNSCIVIKILCLRRQSLTLPMPIMARDYVVKTETEEDDVNSCSNDRDKSSNGINNAKNKNASKSSTITKDPVEPSREDTITMVMVVVMFLACNVLSLAVNVVETFFEPTTLLINYMTDGSNFLIIFNSSVNFIIYIIFGVQFRKVFQKSLDRCRSRLERRRKQERRTELTNSALAVSLELPSGDSRSRQSIIGVSTRKNESSKKKKRGKNSRQQFDPNGIRLAQNNGAAYCELAYNNYNNHDNRFIVQNVINRTPPPPQNGSYASPNGRSRMNSHDSYKWGTNKHDNTRGSFSQISLYNGSRRCSKNDRQNSNHEEISSLVYQPLPSCYYADTALDNGVPGDYLDSFAFIDGYGSTRV